MTDRADLVAAARAWTGTPFKHRGYTAAGCDCIGLLLGACGPLLGIDPAKVMAAYYYRRWPDPRVLLEALRAHCERADVGPRALDRALPRDVLLFRINGRPQHMGLLTGAHPPTMIHSYAKAHRVVEHRVDMDWRSKLLSVWRPVVHVPARV